MLANHDKISQVTQHGTTPVITTLQASRSLSNSSATVTRVCLFFYSEALLSDRLQAKATNSEVQCG